MLLTDKAYSNKLLSLLSLQRRIDILCIVLTPQRELKCTSYFFPLLNVGKILEHIALSQWMNVKTGKGVEQLLERGHV